MKIPFRKLAGKILPAIGLLLICSCEHIQIYSLNIPPSHIVKTEEKNLPPPPPPVQEKNVVETPAEPEPAITPPSPPEEEKAEEERKPFFGPDIPENKKISYEVKEDDTLASIAEKFKTTAEAIQMFNGMDENDLRLTPGQNIRIYKGNWKIKISKKEHKLHLCDGNEIYKTYGICTGENGRTPVGTFEISSKMKNPTWLCKGRLYPFGHKENKLGTRWMSLKPTEVTNFKFTGYGIHGTWRPECIGKSWSNGCVRMKNEDIQELFAIIPHKTEVIIEE